MEQESTEGLINFTSNYTVNQGDIITLAKAYTMYKIGKFLCFVFAEN